MSFTHAKKRKTLRSKPTPACFEPKEYQRRVIEFALERTRAGLFLAPGLGKTIITLTAFRILKEAGLIDEMFVITKRKIMSNVWPREIRKWNLPFKQQIVHGPKKADALYAPADIRLMNFEGLPWLAKQKRFKRTMKRVMLVVDESSALKNTNTVRFRALRKVLHLFERRLALTGSPAPNGMMNIFGQVYVLDDGAALGKFITHFRNQYFYPTGFMGYDWKLQPGAAKRIFKRIDPLIIRFGEDQLDLPPLTIVDRIVKLPPAARRIYDDVEKEFVSLYKGGEIIAANAAVASGKCRQIANGGIFNDAVREESVSTLRKNRPFDTLHDVKCEELVDLLDELNGEPAFVAFEFKHDQHRIVEYFKKNAPRYAKAPFVGGGTKDAVVTRIINQWEKGELPVLFGQPDSVAHGLNLQGKGGIVIYFSLTWNLENYEQFYKRVYRQGQTRRVIIYRIIAKDTVDELMVSALKRKDKVQQNLLLAMEKKHGIR